MGIHEDYILPAIMDVALAGLKDEREQLIGRASGRVLEVGVGNGTNLPYYTAAAQKVVALEPCPTIIERAEKRLNKKARQNQLGIDLARYEFVPGGAEQMAFEDNSFDTAVACLVFCTIPLNRDTETLFTDAGFTYNSIERYRNPKMSPPFAAYMIKGEAVKPL